MKLAFHLQSDLLALLASDLRRSSEGGVHSFADHAAISADQVAIVPAVFHRHLSTFQLFGKLEQLRT